VRKVNLTKTFYTSNRFLIDTTDYLQKPINIILITQQQAFNIAKSLVPDIELRGMRISDQFSDNKKRNKLPPNCWYISYSQVPLQYLSCSNGSSIFLCVSKDDGKVVYHHAV